MAELMCTKFEIPTPLEGGELIASGGANAAASSAMSVTIPEEVNEGLIFINWTRDSDQPINNIAITSGTATLEEELNGKYQYTNAYLRTNMIRISGVSANSTFTCQAGTGASACFYTYAVYKFN